MSSTLHAVEKQEAIENLQSSSATKKRVKPEFGLWFIKNKHNNNIKVIYNWGNNDGIFEVYGLGLG